MVPDQVIFLLVQDNIELACQAIEKAAMDRAVIDVDDSFAAAYEVRRRHREVSLTVLVHRYAELTSLAATSQPAFLGLFRGAVQCIQLPPRPAAYQALRYTAWSGRSL